MMPVDKSLGACGYTGGAATITQLQPSGFIQMYVYDNYGNAAYVDETGMKQILKMLRDVAKQLDWEAA